MTLINRQKINKRADIALYHVKRHGKNNYAFYVSEMENEDFLYQGHTTLLKRDGATMDLGELRKLVGAIAAYYPLVFSANLSCNKYFLIEADKRIMSLAAKNSNFDDFIDNAKRFLHPDCQGAAMTVMSREALLKAYKRGETSVSFYGKRLDAVTGLYGPCEILTVFYINDSGDVCGFTFSRPSM